MATSIPFDCKGKYNKENGTVTEVVCDMKNIDQEDGPSAPPQAQGSRGGAAKAELKKTTERVTYKNRKLIVYQGPRGGKYIKQSGKYVSLSAILLK